MIFCRLSVVQLDYTREWSNMAAPGLAGDNLARCNNARKQNKRPFQKLIRKLIIAIISIFATLITLTRLKNQ